MALKIGDKAPSFNLFNSDKKPVSLEDYKGKNLVLLFFPLAFTSTCTAELCTMRDSLAEFNNLNADILGVSVDTPHTLAKFKEEQRLNFPLASDFNKEASRAYSSIYEEFVLGMKGVSKRSAFVIGPSGNLKYAEVLESAGDQPNYDAIKASLK